MMRAAVAAALLATSAHADGVLGDPMDACPTVLYHDRVPCAGNSQEECSARGCCWDISLLDGIPACYKSPTDVRRIICPFLSTLVNEGALPLKPSYTREELTDVTLMAGLSENSTTEHVDSNFAHNPSGEQDIFNMEGAANEHQTSTGVHDCPTFYRDCHENEMGIGSCNNMTLDCMLPNVDRFDAFFAATDADGNGKITREELEALPEGYPAVIDANPLRVGGTIAGSHQFILDVFGEDNGAFIRKEDMRRVFIDRVYPVGYVFPQVMIR